MDKRNFKMYLPPKTKKLLRNCAKDEGRTQVGVVLRAIEFYLEKEYNERYIRSLIVK